MKKENLMWIVMLLVAVLAVGTWLNSSSGETGSSAETETTTEAETESLEAGET
ncbi:MAG: hypothetical protein LUE63_08215 [Lachnospiraceae bacterium]|nr:hypothetical protein [Lachnospiraceae bacterium]